MLTMDSDEKTESFSSEQSSKQHNYEYYEQFSKPTWVSNKFRDNELKELKNKGNVHFANGKYEQALPYYLAILHRTKHANKNSKLIIDAFNNIALIYFKICKYYQCIDTCDTVLKFSPNHPKAIFRRKKCYDILNKNSKNKKKTNTRVKSATIDTKKLKKMGIIISPLYEVRKLPFDMNTLGFFATKNIKSGTFIFKENILFKYQTNTNKTTSFSPNGNITVIDESNKNIQNILNKLPKNKRYIFTSMRASDIEMNNDFHNIYLTNNVVIDDKFGAICPTACRLNHCCIPNTTGFINKTTNKYCVVAVKDIQKGEQICASFLAWIPTERHERREELLRLYGFICQCKYCHYETFNKYEPFIKEFAGLRKEVLNFEMNNKVLKDVNIMDKIKRIMFILKNCYNSNAYYLDDYSEHAFLCAMLKGDLKNIIRYTSEHAFWSNLKKGYITDNGKKQFEYKFEIPQSLKERDWDDINVIIQKMINVVIREKAIPDTLYQGPFAE
eukprot:232754_1